MKLRTLVFVLLAGCGPVDLTVIAVDGGGGTSCSDDVDCDVTEFCQRDSCAGTTGECVTRPAMSECGSEPSTVCGCDDVEYFNDCYRRALGVGLKKNGRCDQLRGCDTMRACPHGTCLAFVHGPSECGFPLRGKCFVLPATCPTVPDRFIACDQAPLCLDKCQAAASGKNVFPAFQQCQ